MTASGRKAADAGEPQNGSVPVEIGYMNVIPKCLDSSGKYPLYENLPETYAAINSYLADNPLEGLTFAVFLLWSPYAIGQTIIFSSCGFFFFFLSFFFFLA